MIKRQTVLIPLALAAALPGGLPANGENLFSQDQYQSFVADKRAYRVGDNLVLLIIENSKAQAASDRSVERQYGVSGGYETNGEPETAGIEFNVDREAADTRRREGNLKATMAVSVVAVDALGNLSVSGQQRIILNGEEQLIAVEGTVRPIDVNSDNTVYSNRLAGARIEYNGYDVNDDGQKRNWLYRTLSKIGLI